jgi:hypothetical protein
MNNCQHTRTMGHPQDSRRERMDCGADVPPIFTGVAIPGLPEGGQAFPGTSDTRTPEEVSDYIKGENAGLQITMSTADSLSTHLPAAESESGEL